MMRITRQHPFTKKLTTRELPITSEQMDAWQNGALIQDVMPHLSDGDREWLSSGIPEDEFDEMFKPKGDGSK